MTDTLQRHIGLGGAVFTLVGYVIGASIFVLPGQLSAQVGPGLVLRPWARWWFRSITGTVTRTSGSC